MKHFIAASALFGAASAAIAGNPFSGYQVYANPGYAGQINTIAIPAFTAAGKTSLATKAASVTKVGTFYWLDVAAKVPNIATLAADVRAKNKAGAKILLPLVVYDLPDRDCAALASNGEYSIANGGLTKYYAYIDAIYKQLNAFTDVRTVLVIEPDSLANLVTNLGVPKCSGAQDAYKAGVTYALKTLGALPQVAMYIDAGHAGWLGWPANIGPAATLFAQIRSAAGSPASLRGLATNVANYNAWYISYPPAYTSGDPNYHEQLYINAIAPLLNNAGWPGAHFITDTSRNGVQPTRQNAWGDWCNVIGTGFGVRPTSTTGDALADAFVWIKPGGEADGTSDRNAARFDAHCGYSDALQPAPEAGTWFQAYFEQLLTNANPAF